MNQNIIQSQTRSCLKCGYQHASIDQKICPLCGGRLKTKAQIRILGFLLTFLSAFLIAFMSQISLFVYTAVQQSDKPGINARFTGSKDELMMIIAIFGCIFLFGVVGLITGLWQVIFGKRNKILGYTVLALGVVLFAGGFMFRFYVGKQ